ncbi:MAG: hypothetical protein ACRCYQ_06610 [Nocardioides sp.]
MDSKELKKSIQSVGEAPALASVSTVVLYDSSDGRIVHLHETLTMDGAERRSADDRRRSAREVAAELGAAVDDLEIVEIDDFAIEPDTAYRVEAGTRKLVEVPVESQRAAP